MKVTLEDLVALCDQLIVGDDVPVAVSTTVSDCDVETLNVLEDVVVGSDDLDEVLDADAVAVNENDTVDVLDGDPVIDVVTSIVTDGADLDCEEVRVSEAAAVSEAVGSAEGVCVMEFVGLIDLEEVIGAE